MRWARNVVCMGERREERGDDFGGET